MSRNRCLKISQRNFADGTMWNVYRLSTTTKRKTNYHIHLIFSERRLLPEPDIKIATRSVFYDETGKRVRTKKEITDESGKSEKAVPLSQKGGIYEQHLFKTVKDDRFKATRFFGK